MGLITDVFNQNAFGLIDFQETVVERVDYRPQLLGSLNIFEPIYSRSRTIGMVERNRSLTMIPTSADGAPPSEYIPTGKNLRTIQTVRLAKGSTVFAYELAGVAALPGDLQFVEVSSEVANRSQRIMEDLELTWEHMRLGAIFGKVYDADGATLLYNWFTEFGIAEPAEINFALNLDTTNVRKKVRDLKRAMQIASKGNWTPGTRVHALCGDNFFDMLVEHKQYKETRLNNNRTAELENIEGFDAVLWEGVLWINYRGTDDGSSLSIDTNKVRFFPVGMKNAFNVGWGPANEFKPYLNRAGQPKVGLVLEDKSGRDAWDRIEFYSYPVFACRFPEMLQSGKAQ